MVAQSVNVEMEVRQPLQLWDIFDAEGICETGAVVQIAWSVAINLVHAGVVRLPVLLCQESP